MCARNTLVDPEHGITPEEFEGIQRRIVAEYGAGNRAKNLARTLRLTGTWNLKPGREPHRVRIIRETGARCSRDELLAAQSSQNDPDLFLGNYATCKHLKVKQWPADNPRWVFHFTPTSAFPAPRLRGGRLREDMLWLNAVEGFFSVITRRRIRRGVFRSAAELEDAIRRRIRGHNGSAKPFVWTKTAKEIRGKIKRLPAPSE